MAGERILVVDDNLTNLKLARVLLTGEGYEVRVATGSTEAIELLKSFSPALILMDLQLPEMDGLELTKLLKKDPTLERVPIVALTANAMKGDEERALEAGCDGYITKPIELDTFGRRVAEYLHDRSA